MQIDTLFWTIPHQAQWILEGDIKSCFDEINHNWLMNNIKTDKQILDKWLKSGIINKNKLHEEFYETNKGTPQGSIISPTLANITLNGMEDLLKDLKGKYKVHVITYADDFVVTAKSKEILQELVKPRIEAFLKIRGLQLSQEKTNITHISKGFDFLGFNVRKYKEKLFVKPSKGSIKDFLQDTKRIIKIHKTVKTEDLIRILNPKIRGWANYYRHVVSKEVFNHIDENIHWSLWKWSRRKHPNKSSTWTKNKYYRSNGSNNWIFHAKTKHKGETSSFDIVQASKVPIIRHVKIRGHANPFDPNYKEYFQSRKIKDSNSNKRKEKEMILIRK